MYVFFGAGKSRSANKIRLFCFEDGLYVAKGRRNGGLNNFGFVSEMTVSVAPALAEKRSCRCLLSLV